MTLKDCRIGQMLIRRNDGRVTHGRVIGIDAVGPQRGGPCVWLEVIPGEPWLRVTALELEEFEEFK